MFLAAGIACLGMILVWATHAAPSVGRADMLFGIALSGLMSIGGLLLAMGYLTSASLTNSGGNSLSPTGRPRVRLTAFLVIQIICGLGIANEIAAGRVLGYVIPLGLLAMAVSWVHYLRWRGKA